MWYDKEPSMIKGYKRLAKTNTLQFFTGNVDVPLLVKYSRHGATTNIKSVNQSITGIRQAQAILHENDDILAILE